MALAGVVAAPVTVVVDQPVDWVGGVLVPVVAILLSSAIAIWLARNERRRSDQDQTKAAVTSTMRALLDLAHAARSDEQPTWNQLLIRAMAEINALATQVGDGEPVARYCALVLSRAEKTGEGKIIANTSNFLMAALEGWLAGKIRTREFAHHAPDDTNDEWHTTVDLSQWPLFASPGTPADIEGPADGHP